MDTSGEFTQIFRVSLAPWISRNLVMIPELLTKDYE